MKKIVFMVCCLLILATGVFYFLQDQDISKTDPASLFPVDALAVVEIKNLKQRAEEFKVCPLGKAIEAIDVVQVATEIGVSDPELSFIRRAENAISDFYDSHLLEVILGREFVIGLLALEGQTLREITDNIESNILIAARPEYNPETLANLGSVFSRNGKMSSSQYGKHLINKFDFGKDSKLSLVTVDKLVLLALDERVIRASLDRYDNNDLNMLDNINYLHLKKKFQHTELFSYFSFDAYRKSVKKNSSGGNRDVTSPNIQLLSSWQSVECAAMGAWQEGEKLQEKAIIVLDEKHLEPYLQEMLSHSPEVNDLSFATKKALAYYWNNTFHLPSVITTVGGEMLNDETRLVQLQQSLEEITGVDYDSLVTSIGNNVGGIIQHGTGQDFIPLPALAVFLEVTNDEPVKKVLEKLLLHWGIPYDTITHKGVKLYFWGSVPQAGMQPVVGFYGNYFLAASSVEMIKGVIDTKEKGENLIEEESFRKVSSLLMNPNNKVLYMRVEDLVEIVKELVSWGGTMIAIKDRQTAYTSTILIDKVINPLLDGLKMYSVVGARTYFEKDQIITTATTVINKQ